MSRAYIVVSVKIIILYSRSVPKIERTTFEENIKTQREVTKITINNLFNLNDTTINYYKVQKRNILNIYEFAGL